MDTTSRRRRPSEGERTSASFPPAVIHAERAATYVMTQQISTTMDRIHIRHIRDGCLVRTWRFTINDVPLLRYAIDLARGESDVIRNIVNIPMRCGGVIQLGASKNVILVRFAFDGVPSRQCAHLVGAEVDALEAAIQRLESNAAHEGHLRRTNGEQ